MPRLEVRAPAMHHKGEETKILVTFLARMQDQQQPKSVDPDVSFCKAYETTVITSNLLSETIEKCHQAIRRVTMIPRTTIQNHEVFTHPPFCSSSIDRDAQSFYTAALAVFEFINYMSTAIYLPDVNIQPFADKIRGELQDDWTDCAKCPMFLSLLRASFGLVVNDDLFLDSSYTPQVLDFLANTVLLQSKVCQSRYLQLFLEIVGRVFVFKAITDHPRRVKHFIEAERRISKDEHGNEEPSNDFQIFLLLVQNIAALSSNAEFSLFFHREGNDFLHFAIDFVSPALFSTFLQTMAALIKNEELALNIYTRLNESISDVVNLNNFYLAIRGHANDFAACEIDRRKLSMDDALGLQSVLQLTSSMFLYSSEIRKNIADNPEYDFVNSLFQIILSPVPATLKAHCFDVLSTLTIDSNRCTELWGQLETCQILTQAIVDSGKGGIITDIDTVEAEERSYPLARSFVRFLAYIVKDSPPPIDFRIFHQFLFEHCLLKIKTRLFSHLCFNEKWALICELSQCWTYLTLHPLEQTKYVFRSAFCDHRFIEEYNHLLNEDDCPQETLLCIYRLFLVLTDKQEEFTSTMDTADRSSYIPVTKNLSWKSQTLIKIIKSIGATDPDLQIISIKLANVLALEASSIAQQCFSKGDAKAIPTFRQIISIDVEEDTDLIEKNPRLTLLDFLISLGNSSYFMRYVCGFDNSDIPYSLLRSHLEKGILPKVLEKMRTTDAAKNYPLFAAKSLQLMLLLADHPYTQSPLLNLLFSNQTFFDSQLKLLQDRSTSLITIGCYLQLLARGVVDKSYIGTTIQTFGILMGTEVGAELRPRAVLIVDFVERMNDEEESIQVGKGVFQVIISFLNHEYVQKEMKQKPEVWQATWIQFIHILLRKAAELTTHQSTQFLTDTAGFVGEKIIGEHLLKSISHDDMAAIFDSSLTCLKSLHSHMQINSSIGVYSLISCCNVDGLFDVFNNFERYFLTAVQEDMLHDLPIGQAAVYSAFEKVIPVAHDDSIRDFVSMSIGQLPGDWDLVEGDIRSGTFVLRAKFNFFSRLITTKDEFGQLLISESLINNIAYQSFWETIAESYSTAATSEISEIKLKTASKALQILSALCVRFEENADIIKQTTDFFNNYRNVFVSVIEFGGMSTLISLRFLKDLCTFITLSPWLVDDELHAILLELKERVKKREQWHEFLRQKSGSYEQPDSVAAAEAEKLLNNIEKYYLPEDHIMI